MFVTKLEEHFNNTKICKPIVRDTNVVTLEKTIEELCKIIKEEVEEKKTKEIWINISTSTKLFVSAAMYVGSFYPKTIKLFYLDARHYTVNLLLEKMSKESITEKFQKYGLSYKKDDDSFKSIEVPTYTMEILKNYKRNIIITLKKIIDRTKKETVSFMNLLQELGEKKDDKRIKVRYGHHIAYLKKRNWVYEKSKTFNS